MVVIMNICQGYAIEVVVAVLTRIIVGERIVWGGTDEEEPMMDESPFGRDHQMNLMIGRGA